MYQIKNTVYADAGHVLKYKQTIAFKISDVNINEVSEIRLDINDIQKDGNFIKYSDTLKELIKGSSYKDWKIKWVNKLFPNDDQIAIMLNKDDSEEDLFLFNKMQEWRVWSGAVAKKIVELLVTTD